MLDQVAAPRGVSLGIVAVAVIVAALGAAAAVSLSRPKAEAVKVAVEPAISKGVRVVPIYKKIEDRAPMEAPTPAETTIDKTPAHAAAKADTPLPPMQQAKVEPEPEIELPTRRHYGEHGAEVRDVCTRHGLRKVMTHNGRGWRCR
jgi:type IV secretory pathway VirB10-like protein